MFRKIILLLFFAIITLAHLSAVSSHPNKIESNYKIRRISPDGGLSINGQRDVRQDKWGIYLGDDCQQSIPIRRIHL